MVRSVVALLIAMGWITTAQAEGSAGKTTITWYGHAAFVVKTPKGTVLATDPWFSNPTAKKAGLRAPDRIDFILLTHGHYDHAGDVLALGKATQARLVTSQDLARALAGAGYPFDLKTIVAPGSLVGNVGGTIRVTDEVSVSIVPAVHSSIIQKDPTQAQQEYGGPATGLVIRIQGGPTIYQTGDTNAFSDMQLIPRVFGPIDVMLVCIGDHFTMGPAGAAQAVAWVQPKTVVPMHFGTYGALTGTPAEFGAALKQSGASAQMLEMKPGETRAF